MRENRTYGSEGGGPAEMRSSLPLFLPGFTPGEGSDLGALGRPASRSIDGRRKSEAVDVAGVFQCYCQTDGRADNREVGRGLRADGYRGNFR